MKPSEIKLEEFNNCPGADAIKQWLYENNLNPYIEFVDLDSRKFSWYQNDAATLMLAIKDKATESTVALALGKMAVENNADEFHWKVIDGMFVVRLWWD